MRHLAVLAVLLGATLALGCVHRHDPHHEPPRGPGAHRGHGPPPHAPAHGYRAKMHGRHLEFDARRGVYVVIGLPGVYWQGGWYYRLWRDRWQRSGTGDGPWHDARWGDIPTGLRGGKGPGRGHGAGHGPGGKGKGKGKGKGHGPGKKGY